MKKTFVIFTLVLLSTGMILSGAELPTAHAATQEQIDKAINNGLLYLSKIQDPYSGSWNASFGYPVANTAMAVLAFENNGHHGWDTSDQYHTTVQNGLNYLFLQGQNVSIGIQPGGNDPDTNHNSIGINFSDPQNQYYPIYETSMVLMAMIASTSNPKASFTSPGPLGVRTYYDIAQDTVDYLAWAQDDINSSYSGRGGWSYIPNDWEGGSDNSNTPWPVMALMAAELWGLTVPSFVALELRYWITTCQSPHLSDPTNPLYGAFDYWGGHIDGRVAEAAAGMLEMEFAYADEPMPNTSTTNFTAAEGFITSNNDYVWTYSGVSSSCDVNFGNLYCMYAVMKAMREASPPIRYIEKYDGTNGVEWYNGPGEYADALVTNQNQNAGSYLYGSWINWVTWEESGSYSTSLSTALGVLILTPSPPVEVNYQLVVQVEDAKTLMAIRGATVQVSSVWQTLTLKTPVFWLNPPFVVFYPVLASNSPIWVTAYKAGYYPSEVSIVLTGNSYVIVLLKGVPRQSWKQGGSGPNRPI